MKIKLYGVRGSVPISRDDSQKYGGNTTCVRIISDCVPKGSALVIDAGSGFVALSRDLLGEQVFGINLLMTHYHHDHTQGLPLAPHTFIDTASFKVWGPKEHGHGPAEVFGEVMKAPHFPVDFAKVRDRFKCVAMDHIGNQVLVMHPKAGAHLLPIEQYRVCNAGGKQLPLGKAKHDIAECLLVFMWKTAHPEYTVSYRVEERPTGKVFVFLTDHENTCGFPKELLAHVQGANLLVQDSQYSDIAYQERYAGFGHGTPEYCAKLALKTKVGRLGLTHHDPNATDSDVEMRLAEAMRVDKDSGLMIFACKCYQEVTV